MVCRFFVGGFPSFRTHLVPSNLGSKEVFLTTPIVIRSTGVSLLLIVLAVVCFIVAALGVGSKLGFNLVDLGLAFFAGSFIF